jgi:hypothetical protein
MKKVLVPNTKQALLLAVCFLFTFMTIGAALATAESTGTETDRSVFFGKVTAVDGNSITVAIATMTMPEDFGKNGNRGGSPNGQNGTPGSNDPNSKAPANGNAPQGSGRSFADTLTYTGESVTIQITDSIALTKQGSPAEPNKNAPNPPDAAKTDGSQRNNNMGSQGPQGTMPAGQGPGFTGEEAALEDITVDSIVVLTYQTSTQTLLSVHILSMPQAAGKSPGSVIDMTP